MKKIKNENSKTQQELKKTYETPKLIVHGTVDEITKVLNIHRLEKMPLIGASLVAN